MITRLTRVLATLNGLDAGLTLALVSMGVAEESNPLMGALLRVSPLVFLGVKFALVEWASGFLSRQITHQRQIAVALVMMSAIYTGLVAYHLWHIS